MSAPRHDPLTARRLILTLLQCLIFVAVTITAALAGWSFGIVAAAAFGAGERYATAWHRDTLSNPQRRR